MNELSLSETLLILGAVLAIAAALSGWAHGTVLSISVLALAAGVGLAAADVVSLSPEEEGIIVLVEVALLLTLFADGLHVEEELLREHWRPPARALFVAMPVTLVLLALGARLLFGDELDWADAFLVAAVLVPTDPVITSAIVTSRKVPRVVRHTLNLESGLNDGLALPFVLLFLLLVTAEEGVDVGTEVAILAGESVLGAVIGAAIGFFGGRILGLLPGGGIRPKYEGIYALALAFGAFGLAEILHGNGLIAAFIAGLILAVTRHEIPAAFTTFNESLGAILQVMVFLALGVVIVTTGWSGKTWALVVFILFAIVVARPAAVWISFIGVKISRSEKLFISWFGPKGVASILFALFVLDSTAADRTIVFEIAVFTVLTSILLHGLTDTIGADWMARRVRRLDEDDASETEPEPLVPPS